MRRMKNERTAQKTLSTRIMADTSLNELQGPCVLCGGVGAARCRWSNHAVCRPCEHRVVYVHPQFGLKVSSLIGEHTKVVIAADVSLPRCRLPSLQIVGYYDTLEAGLRAVEYDGVLIVERRTSSKEKRNFGMVCGTLRSCPKTSGGCCTTCAPAAVQ